MTTNKGTPDLKQLMQEKLKNREETKVNSPLAKYNYKGQLTCIVCGITIKNSVIWQAHIIKKSHLQNLERIKGQQQQLNSSNDRKQLEKKDPTPESNGTKRKRDAPKGILKKLSTYSSSSDSEEEIPRKVTKYEPLPQKESPMDWEPTSKQSGPSQSQPPKDNNALPEGFFDDPVADAKARKVEYVDKDQEQYDEFYKSIAEAEAESRNIIAEDDEEAALRKRVEEADEQIMLLKKFINLADTVEKKKKDKNSKQVKQIKEESDESSGEEFAVVDWRAKKAR